MSKPCILIGNGCRYNVDMVDYICSLGIPVLTTWMGIDLVPEDSPVFCGRPGAYGQRAANIIEQKADSIYIFGARLDDGQTAFSLANFAPNAKKYVYDVDVAELTKLPDDWIKYPQDITKMLTPAFRMPNIGWLQWCKDLYARFRPELEGGDNPKYVDPFRFIAMLSEYAQPDDVIALGSSGFAPQSFMQAFKVKKGQRITNCSTIGAMGADIPMAIGACLASGKKRTICVTGDGGFMLNVQELEVVRRLELPIQFFIYNNNGYDSIRRMQDLRFEGRHVACDPDSGFTIPNLEEIADCFGLDYKRVMSIIDDTEYNADIIDLDIDPTWQQYPKVMSSIVNGKSQPDRMENMTPKLDPDELKRIMEE